MGLVQVVSTRKYIEGVGLVAAGWTLVYGCDGCKSYTGVAIAYNGALIDAGEVEDWEFVYRDAEPECYCAACARESPAA